MSPRFRGDDTNNFGNIGFERELIPVSPRTGDLPAARRHVTGRQRLAEYLLPLAEAFKRFMPDVIDIDSRTMIYSQADQFKAGVVEGDLTITGDGLAMTNELVPAFNNARMAALFITGSLLAPNATIAEPDIDWSPMLKIKGSVVAKNLCLGGSASEIDGDVTVEGVLMG